MGAAMKTHDELTNSVVLLKRMLYWRMAFFSLILMLAGVAIGASAMHMWVVKQRSKPQPRPAVNLKRVMRRVDKQLNLTPEQSEQVRPVIRRCLADLDQVRAEARPQIRQHLRLMNRDIQAVLEPEQQKQWKRIARRLMNLLQGRAMPRLQANPNPMKTSSGSEDQPMDSP